MAKLPVDDNSSHAWAQKKCGTPYLQIATFYFAAFLQLIQLAALVELCGAAVSRRARRLCVMHFSVFYAIKSFCLIYSFFTFFMCYAC